MDTPAILLRGARVYVDGAFISADLKFSKEAMIFSDSGANEGFTGRVVDCENCIIIPGLADVHVHLREPGLPYKETIADGSRAAARGGYTLLCAMPNVVPPPDSMNTLKHMLNIIEKDAVIKVLPYGTITAGQRGKGKLSDMDALAPHVCGFSDDGRGIQHSELMETAMYKAKELCKPIVAHCEDETLLVDGGCIHDGKFAKRGGFIGISSESEWKQLERDIDLVRKTGCQYHVCHVSTKESVALIRQAKREGLPVTAETAPHYLVFCDRDLLDEGRFRMNPPIRAKEDRDALIEGICDGTIDIIATDHAPHSEQEKSGGLRNSLFGIVGLETAFPVLYTQLVKKGVISLEKLIDIMAVKPREIFGIDMDFANSAIPDFTLIDLSAEYKINPADFLSKGRSTPFEGMKVSGKTLMTVYNGEIVYSVLTL